MNISNLRKINKGSLIAGFSVELTSGLNIHDVMLHATSGAYWVSFPSKPVIEAGRHVTEPTTGKGRYGAPLISFASRDVADGFKNGIVGAVRRNFPELFADSPQKTATGSVVPLRAEAAAPLSDQDIDNSVPY